MRAPRRTVTDELTLEFCDPTAAEPPAGWDGFVRTGPLHPVWHWSVVRTLATPRRRAAAAAAVQTFEAAVRREYGRRVVAVCYRQVYADALPVLARGIGVVHQGGDVAVFHNRFADYDGYLRSLSTKRRKDQSRLVRRTDA